MLNNDTEAKALVVYKSKQSNRIDLTCHDVVSTNKPGEFVLGAGRAFSVEDREALVDVLLNVEDGVEFLNPRILVKSRSCLVWYTPPQRIDVMVKEDGPLRSFNAPIPGLLYIATGGKLRCYAYKGKNRPDADTLLYRPPLGNVYGDGSFCTGNAKTPGDHSVSSIEGWENFVLRCTNTHLGGVSVINGVSDYKAFCSFYQTLSEKGAKSFPSGKLVAVYARGGHQTLEQAVMAGGA
ncbi:PRTRC system protein B [Pseudomonas sp. NCHU5208]|uniref:PRTRC system protein B n=1 Tax=unclassified Pseudomonas TaxID=196821 RepID=UPI003F955B2D